MIYNLLKREEATQFKFKGLKNNLPGPRQDLDLEARKARSRDGHRYGERTQFLKTNEIFEIFRERRCLLKKTNDKRKIWIVQGNEKQ